MFYDDELKERARRIARAMFANRDNEKISKEEEAETMKAIKGLSASDSFKVLQVANCYLCYYVELEELQRKHLEPINKILTDSPTNKKS